MAAMRLNLTSAVAVLLLIAGTARSQCEIAQVVGADDGDGDFFGGAVAIDGDVAVVGDSPDFGEVYVYRLDDETWQEEAVLTAEVPEFGDGFGQRVAVSGNTILVAAPSRKGPTGSSDGAVYVFDHDGSSWEHVATLRSAKGQLGGFFGYALALNGDVAVVGAPFSGIPGTYGTGSIYVFHRVGPAWQRMAFIESPDPDPHEAFGRSVAVDGDVVLAGAGAFNTPELVHVFRHVESQWVLEDEIRSPEPGSSNRFGVSLAIKGRTAVIGAMGYDGQNGAVYVYSEVPRTRGRPLGHDGECPSTPRIAASCWRWVQTGLLTTPRTAGPQPLLGFSVALSDDERVLLTGAPLDYTAGFQAGAAYLFRYSESGWYEAAQLVASDAQAGAGFGTVSMDGDLGLIGAPNSTGFPGAAYFFAGFSNRDCNGNGEPDACDILIGESEDSDGDGVPDECGAGAADLNLDGLVDGADLSILLSEWGACPAPCPPVCTGDLDGDCVVGFDDLIRLLSRWD